MLTSANKRNKAARGERIKFQMQLSKNILHGKCTLNVVVYVLLRTTFYMTYQ
jgi:hypothetical protein